MVISNDFYNSAGVLRWNLGWASPNYAGAFLATLIPFARVGRRRLPALALEAALVFMLCKTQSRGALLALAAAWAHAHLVLGGEGGWRRFGWRLLLLAACVWLARFSSRIEPNYLAGDLSIRNRLQLWKGCLKVLVATPLGGCPAGSSGRLYRAWFQPLEQSIPFPTPINSYLFAIIEWGWLLAGAVLAALAFAVAAAPSEGGRGGPWGRRLGAAAGSSIVGWATASLFSTLWDEPPLWIVPAGAVALSAGRALLRRGAVRPAAAALAFAVGAEAAAWAAGLWLIRGEPIVPRVVGAGVTRVEATHRVSSRWPPCHVWLDRDVLGFDAEKELRRWLALEGSPSVVVVHDRWADPRFDPADGDAVVLVGRSAERLGRTLAGRYARVVLVAPIAPDRSALPAPPGAVVVMPGIDQDGGSLEELRCGADPSVRILVAPGVGDDLRADWPRAMDEVDRLFARS